ncbi:twin-arginine translocation signal domain-containing protein [Nonomuraea basaltis]|nr:twin-arginine translocation signal domain-containing protein [Nonomuraea basaltis]
MHRPSRRSFLQLGGVAAAGAHGVGPGGGRAHAGRLVPAITPPPAGGDRGVSWRV